jgi:glycosyltransferase involved in cell wall biosynthesis
MEIMEESQAHESLGLSVIIITKNEARNIAACLESVRFADEVIVLDSCSTDGTADIARSLGAKVVVSEDWPGFGRQKNRALELATQQWVLSIDADERVTPALQAEIIQTLRTPKFEAYNIARLSEFCGKPIRHSGWWPDYVLRLFRRGVCRFNDAPVHERIEANVPVGQFRYWLLHFPFDNLDMLVAKINRYSLEAALVMAAKGKKAGVLSASGHCVWTFIRIYILKHGFLDGRHGFVLAVAAAFGSFLRYSKLMFLNQSDRESRRR